MHKHSLQCKFKSRGKHRTARERQRSTHHFGSLLFRIVLRYQIQADHRQPQKKRQGFPIFRTFFARFSAPFFLLFFSIVPSGAFPVPMEVKREGAKSKLSEGSEPYRGGGVAAGGGGGAGARRVVAQCATTVWRVVAGTVPPDRLHEAERLRM